MLPKNDLIVITGAGGFIGGNLVRYFYNRGLLNIRAVDKKPLDEWYQRIPAAVNLQLDCSTEGACAQACDGAQEVYNLAADMGARIRFSSNGLHVQLTDDRGATGSR